MGSARVSFFNRMSEGTMVERVLALDDMGMKIFSFSSSSAERMAEDALRSAGEYHFSLESIYVPCMDFKSQNEYARELFKKMTKYFH